MLRVTPGGDGELLRDAIARAIYNHDRTMLPDGLLWDDNKLLSEREREGMRLLADSAIEATGQFLREHPEAIAEVWPRPTVGWTNETFAWLLKAAEERD